MAIAPRSALLAALTADIRSSSLSTEECVRLTSQTVELLALLHARQARAEASVGFATFTSAQHVRLVLDQLDEDDALSAALTCRIARDAVFERFPQRCFHDVVSKRLRTRARALVASLNRMRWAALNGWRSVCTLGVAVLYGPLEVIRTMYEAGITDDQWADVGHGENMGRRGDVEVLQWARATERKVAWDMVASCAAAEGNVAAVDFAVACGADTGHAKAHGLPELLNGGGWHLGEKTAAQIQQLLPQLMTALSLTWQDRCVAGNAAHLEVVRWMHSQGAPIDFFDAESAVNAGRLDTLRWLRENGNPLKETYGLCRAAAEGGHLEILKWLRANEVPWQLAHLDDSYWNVCGTAAAGGHLELLKWARNNGARWDESACACAAACGHLEVLQWLRTNDCPWKDRGSQVCANAAAGGHLQLLQWARQNGAAWYMCGTDICACEPPTYDAVLQLLQCFGRGVNLKEISEELYQLLP